MIFYIIYLQQPATIASSYLLLCYSVTGNCGGLLLYILIYNIKIL